MKSAKILLLRFDAYKFLFGTCDGIVWHWKEKCEHTQKL